MVSFDGVNNNNSQKINKTSNAQKLQLKRELLFKILVIGDFGVGKTSIIKRYADGSFSPTYKITIGADFAVKTLQWDEKTKVNLQLWDIAGHERFGYLTGVYYRYAVAAAIVFDLTRPETFGSTEKWLLDLKEKVALPNGGPIPIVLLANKGDVNISVPPQIKQFCKVNNILAWFITSAKTNENIDEAINLLMSRIMENHENTVIENSEYESIKLKEIPKQVNKKSPCCQ